MITTSSSQITQEKKLNELSKKTIKESTTTLPQYIRKANVIHSITHEKA